MSLRVANPLWRWLILLLALAVFSVVGYSSGAAALADQLESSTSTEDLQHAARLEPGSGDYWYKLGQSYLWDIDHSDVNKAIENFNRAASADPRSAPFATALAGAYESTGQEKLARKEYEAALEDYPSSPDVHWRYGSFLLRQLELQQAYPEIRKALTGDPRLAPLATSRIWFATRDIQGLLESVLPADMDDYQAALEWFCDEKEPDAALAVWKKMVSLGRTIPAKNSFPLIDLLLAMGRGNEARQTWIEALTASGNAGAAKTGESLVFNGGFEFDALNGGLDWHVSPDAGFSFAYDTSEFHGGRRSLRVNFDGTRNVGFQNVWQTVIVEPGKRYHFEGFLRTAGISTDSGVRFTIAFPGGTQPAIVLENLTGDHPWSAQAADFTPEAGVHSVRILVSRDPSQKFDNKLAGTAWVDDVSIIPAESAARK